MARACLLLAVVASAKADIVVTRTVDSVAGAGKLTVDHDCSSSDQYGSNDCDVHWGDTYNARLQLSLTEDIEQGATFSVSAHIDHFFPLSFSCPACGGNCSITIPVVGKTVSFTLPDCPITARAFDQNITVALPSSSPVPIRVSATGTAALADAAGTTLAHVSFTATVSPSLVESSGLGQCEKYPYDFCCAVGTPCDCTKGTTSPGQCKPESYLYCCNVGTPCDCSQPP